MEPNRHHEYQTHHQPHPPMQHHPTHPHHQPAHHQPAHHPQQPIHQHHPPPPQQQQQPPPPQQIHQQPHPHHYQQLHHHPTSSTAVGSSSSASYGNHHPQHHTTTLAEDQRSRPGMYLSRSSQPGLPPPPHPHPPAQGSGASGPGGSDPHMQYYTSNQNLALKKMPDPHPSWSYKSQAVPAPASATGLRQHGNPGLYSTGSTAYWPPPDEQMHHQQPSRYAYGKPGGPLAGSRPIPGPLPNSQRYYSEDIKYSSVPAASKVVTYAPPASSSQPQPPPPSSSSSANSSTVRHYELEHVVNPINPSNEHQQPSPNYGRKCPPHYETPPEQRSAGATPNSTGTPTSTSHHQSLYIPMPTFSTEKFQTTVHNAIEKYVRETPGPSLEYPRGGSAAGVGAGSGAAYGRTGYYNQQPVKNSKPAPPAPQTATSSYVKMDPEHALTGSLPQPTRSSLYHNPYNVESRERDSSPAIATVPAPHGYPTKYGKLIQQQHAGGVGAASSTPYTNYYLQGTPSPAAGAVASPTPAPAPPPAGAPGTIVGPGTALGPGIPPHISQPAPAPANSQQPASSSSNASSTLQVYPHGPDICYQPGSQSQVQSQSQSQSNPAKKPPTVTKPNYRALINDMLKRNTASEQELNLQIIKKTLNMDPPARNHPAPSRVIQQGAAHTPPVVTSAPHPPPPAIHSPLDLSMRTVKQTADSTEYKYQRPSTDNKLPQAGLSGGLGLPRFDITPNFSAATRSGAPTSPAPTAVIRQAPALPAAAPLPPTVSVPPVAAAPALVIKTLQQMRPSVVETNPFAKRQQQLPPETSIVQVNKPPVELMPTPSPSPHNSSNPNYLGRKRHLQEYNQAAAKQARLDAESSGSLVAAAPVIAAPTSVVVVAPVPVIAVNEQALAAKREREMQPVGVPESSTSANPMPKVEPRIRTKAELKGFTFTPPVLVTSTTNASSTISPPRTPPNQVTNHIQIKLEPAPPKAADLGLEDELSLGNLMDWGSTCNNLVEQLLTKVVVPPALPVSTGIKLELSEDDLPVARILKRQPLPPVAPAGGDAESATTQLTTTTNGISSSLGNGSGQKKLSKVEREKKRLQQEKRIAARLAPKQGQSSSSESDTTELHKRNSARQKKPLLRKGRARQRSPEGASIQQSSDEEQEKVKQRLSRSQTSSEESKRKATSTKKEVKKEVKTPNNKASNNTSISKSAKKQLEASTQKKSKSEENPKQESQESSSSESPEEDEDEDEDDQEEEEEEDEEPEEDDEGEQNKKKEKRVGRRPGTTLKKRIAHKLNTMTRSKHRKELELQLANSKVLRNDKIIRNSTTKIKRKYVRKVVDSKKEMMVTRLRNKRGLNSDLGPLNGRNAKLKGTKVGSSPGKPAKTSPQQQMYLEEYRYKLALKIPHRLISINKLNKVAASLPDLERRDLGQELSCFKRNRPKTKAASKQDSTPKSIIDVLHLRVTNGSTAGTQRKISVSAPASTNLQIHSETSQTSASTSLYEQPQQEATDNQSLDDLSKRHFSIFDTKVLQSKTRTESKLQKHREIIREIFVGPERPASAPPECAQEADAGDAISYQKYEEFLQQMNTIASANDNKLARRSLMEDKSALAPQCPHKRKYRCRKGSSGFDYIRKKKRPTVTQNPSQNHSQNHTQSQSSSQLTQHLLEHNQSAADERLDDTDSTIAGSSHLPPKVKTANDVCREIQKWVLNKGVGQSTMHKAARQGLIDVVVYCLDHLNMNPDQKDNAGYTPLHEACTQGWLEIARILLQFGANHSEAAQSGIRPLHGAIENDHEEVVRLLLSYGADPLLATYSGQTPLMLASSKLMRGILRAHLSDAQSAAADIKPMRFHGPWEIFDAKEYGYDIFDNVPNTACDMSRALRRERKEAKQQRISHSTRNSSANGNDLLPAKKEEQEPEDLDQERVKTIKQNGETSATKTGSATATATTTMVKLEPGTDEDSNNNKNNDELNANVENNLVTSVVNVKNEVKKEVDAETEGETDAGRISRSRLGDDQTDIETMDSELNGDIFEFEEADVPLPPLYLLKDEGSDKWVLLNDLCNLLKVKSKDTLLNKLCPSNSNALASSQKHLLREFKIDDFLEKATCLQLLCAGEKLNMFSSSKVVLIKYNDSVRNLLGVKTILMKF
ncbi:protein piccolo [Drosophila biarmipes]|uniref:protein piccolo n=1 Tax=Drosophila biarmipes TaxID=125945 RepID=UPI0007E77ACB|nr:protein piccolo [Drosophila biarmipes]